MNFKIFGDEHLYQLSQKKTWLFNVNSQILDIDEENFKIVYYYNSQEKISQFQNSLNTLCDLSPTNVKILVASTRTQFWQKDFEI